MSKEADMEARPFTPTVRPGLPAAGCVQLDAPLGAGTPFRKGEAGYSHIPDRRIGCE